MIAGVRKMDRIRIPASVEHLSQVATFITALGSRGHLTSQATYRLRLAADELVTNIAMYAATSPPGEIVLQGDVEDDKVWVAVANEGPRFDPRVMRKDRVPDPARTGQIGGLGLFLVFEAVDEFVYEFTDGVNRSTFSVRRESPPGK